MAQLDPTQDPTLDPNAQPPQTGAAASAPLPPGGGDPSMAPSTTYANNTGVSTPVTPPPAPVDPNMKGLNPAQVAQGHIKTAETEEQVAAREGTNIAQFHKDNADLYGGEAGRLSKGIDDHNKFTAHALALYNSNNSSDIDKQIALGNQKTDPNHWWNSKDTGGKVESIIGLMLGGVGQGMMIYGGNKNARNYGLDAMDDAIKQDIDTQDKDKKTKQDSLANIIGLHKDSDLKNQAYALDQQNQLILGEKVFASKLMQRAQETGSQSAINAAQSQIDAIQDRITDHQGEIAKYAAQIAAQGAALSAQREGKATDIYKASIALGHTPEQAVAEAHALYPEVARYTQGMPGLKGLPGGGTKGDETNQTEFYKQAAPIDAQLGVLHQLLASPSMDLSPDQKKLVGTGTLGGNPDRDTIIKNIAALTAQRADIRQELLGSGGGGGVGTPQVLPPEILIDQNGQQRSVPGAQVQEALQHGFSKPVSSQAGEPPQVSTDTSGPNVSTPNNFPEPGEQGGSSGNTNVNPNYGKGLGSL